MIPVTKYHGCGNDFIITDWERVMNCDIEDFVVKVCDRHTGIGADGCILVSSIHWKWYSITEMAPRTDVRKRYPLLCEILL